ncbi:MAG TPA: DUF3185 domain-containing protein [Gammaproteobacteria bacterium]|jgi:uncharacterized membrane protein YidH (DUF202 family)|nr:DUF3185 domain-containing protein [Gammaproteobacteria bacterium]
MKSIMNIVGIILIIFGIIALGYQGFSYTQREKVMQIGDIQVTANTEKSVHFPPIVGGVSVVAGLILIIINRFNKK